MIMTKMDKIWIATAILIYPKTCVNIKIRKEQILQEINKRWQTKITPVMLEKHLVSWEDRQADKKNQSRGGSRKRYLFRTIDGINPSRKGDFRLYKRNDSQFDGWEKEGLICPKKEKIDEGFHYLIDWYLNKYY